MLIEKARAAARVRMASKKAKEIARKKNSLDVVQLVGKLAAERAMDKEVKEVVFDRANSKINVQDVIFNLRLPKGSKRSLNGLFGDDKDKDSQAERGGKDKDKPQP